MARIRSDRSIDKGARLLGGADGTSFLGSTLVSSVNQLIEVFGEPDVRREPALDDDGGAVSVQWVIRSPRSVFTIYDQGRAVVDPADEYCFYIGEHESGAAVAAMTFADTSLLVQPGV